MTDAPAPTRRILDSSERIAEILFGLIMVLTFTGSLSVAEAGRDDVRTMLIGALGCNFAWGVIDGILYLMGRFAETGRALQSFRAVRRATDHSAARKMIASALPGPIAEVVTGQELDDIARRLKALPEPPARTQLTRRDWLGAGGVFLLVFFATFPVAVPFLFVPTTQTAMRISNAIAIAMLFVAGVLYGRLVGHKGWLAGTGMVLLGLTLVAITIALGG